MKQLFWWLNKEEWEEQYKYHIWDEIRNAYNILAGKSVGEKPLGRYR
jgi:hypothetical protein